MASRMPNWLRWILLFPVSILAGYFTGGLVHFIATFFQSENPGAISYVAAFLAGLGYIWAALHLAHTLAPSHKRIAVVILGFLILGDLCVIQLIGSEVVDLDFIRFILRLNDFDGLTNADLLKFAGAVVGGFLCWWNYVKEESIAKTNTA